jgi:ABC-type bacteriocin/lantibiotic exporter with double-glycine peptidase domain
LLGRATANAGVVGFLALAFAAAWIASDHNKPKKMEHTTDNEADVVYLGSAEVNFQTRSNDCGTAALLMVLDHYGMKSSRRELEQNAKFEFRGASMQRLKELARSAGLEAEGWRLRFEDLATVRFPAILFVENHHFIVADSVDGRGFLFVRDPAVGKLKIPRKKAAAIWSGETLVITRESR